MHPHLVFIMYLQSWTAILSLKHNPKAATTIDNAATLSSLVVSKERDKNSTCIPKGATPPKGTTSTWEPSYRIFHPYIN